MKISENLRFFLLMMFEIFSAGLFFTLLISLKPYYVYFCPADSERYGINYSLYQNFTNYTYLSPDDNGSFYADNEAAGVVVSDAG